MDEVQAIGTNFTLSPMDPLRTKLTFWWVHLIGTKSMNGLGDEVVIDGPLNDKVDVGPLGNEVHVVIDGPLGDELLTHFL